MDDDEMEQDRVMVGRDVEAHAAVCTAVLRRCCWPMCAADGVGLFVWASGPLLRMLRQGVVFCVYVFLCIQAWAMSPLRAARWVIACARAIIRHAVCIGLRAP
jgi:hypothetical protein